MRNKATMTEPSFDCSAALSLAFVAFRKVSFSGQRSRSTYTLLLVVILCAILGTGYLSTTDRDVSSYFSLLSTGKNKNPLANEVVQGQSAGHPPYDTTTDVKVPPGVNVIAVVFFGRRELVKILDCYLNVEPQ
jgi:hypothetical protein